MSRASKADAARHHQEIIEAASRLIRARGVENVSVPEVMGAVGLTRGGFYKHFASKEALIAAAVDATFDQHVGRVDYYCEQTAGDPDQARSAFADFVLSVDNRDHPDVGCPSSVTSDVARSAPDDESRAAFLRGTYALMQELQTKAGEDGLDPQAQQEKILADMCTMIGAVLLARATTGDPLSEAVLDAARKHVG